MKKVLVLLVAIAGIAGTTVIANQSAKQAVEIDHKGKIISVSVNAVAAHIGHGDHLKSNCGMMGCM